MKEESNKSFTEDAMICLTRSFKKIDLELNAKDAEIKKLKFENARLVLKTETWKQKVLEAFQIDSADIGLKSDVVKTFCITEAIGNLQGKILHKVTKFDNADPDLIAKTIREFEGAEDIPTKDLIGHK